MQIYKQQNKGKNIDKIEFNLNQNQDDKFHFVQNNKEQYKQLNNVVKQLQINDKTIIPLLQYIDYILPYQVQDDDFIQDLSDLFLKIVEYQKNSKYFGQEELQFIFIFVDLIVEQQNKQIIQQQVFDILYNILNQQLTPEQIKELNYYLIKILNKCQNISISNKQNYLPLFLLLNKIKSADTYQAIVDQLQFEQTIYDDKYILQDHHYLRYLKQYDKTTSISLFLTSTQLQCCQKFQLYCVIIQMIQNLKYFLQEHDTILNNENYKYPLALLYDLTNISQFEQQILENQQNSTISSATSQNDKTLQMFQDILNVEDYLKELQQKLLIIVHNHSKQGCFNKRDEQICSKIIQELVKKQTKYDQNTILLLDIVNNFKTQIYKNQAVSIFMIKANQLFQDEEYCEYAINMITYCKQYSNNSKIFQSVIQITNQIIDFDLKKQKSQLSYTEFILEQMYKEVNGQTSRKSDLYETISEILNLHQNRIDFDLTKNVFLYLQNQLQMDEKEFMTYILTINLQYITMGAKNVDYEFVKSIIDKQLLTELIQNLQDIQLSYLVDELLKQISILSTLSSDSENKLINIAFDTFNKFVSKDSKNNIVNEVINYMINQENTEKQMSEIIEVSRKERIQNKNIYKRILQKAEDNNIQLDQKDLMFIATQIQFNISQVIQKCISQQNQATIQENLFEYLQEIILNQDIYNFDYIINLTCNITNLLIDKDDSDINYLALSINQLTEEQLSKLIDIICQQYKDQAQFCFKLLRSLFSQNSERCNVLKTIYNNMTQFQDKLTDEEQNFIVNLMQFIQSE